MDTVIDPRRDIIIALTGSGTLFAAVPRGNARHSTRRCRAAGRSGPREESFEGVLLSVREPVIPVRQGIDMVRCGALMFEIVAGSYGRPIVGERMAVGGDSRGVQEVSSRVAWVGVMDIDRTWAIEPMMRAFRNGARHWRSFMTEQPYEQGDEHIEDDGSGSLKKDALTRHYGAYLEDLARQRDAHLARLGHSVMPRHRVVSNEEISARLAEELAGQGMQRLGLPVAEKYRAAMASSFERCWGAVRRMDRPAPEAAKAA